MKSDSQHKVIALITGGVGGAKMARGFVRAFPQHSINIITNTADDTEFYGLHVSPDLDTMMYTLAEMTGSEKGWGIKDDSFQCLSQLDRYGEPAWFRLGDRDFATHILRTKMLREGKTLTQITAHLSQKLGIKAQILPMSNQKVETFIKTDQGMLPFQDYFVRRQQKVEIKKVTFRGITQAKVTGEVSGAINLAHLLVFAPSNPIVSILPILSVPGMRQLVLDSKAFKVSVSPFIGNKAISGPARELMIAKGFDGSSLGVANFYKRLIDVLFIDYLDDSKKELIEKSGVSVAITETIMKDSDASVHLARKIYEVFLSQRGQGL